jgi:uncharacterized protein (TIGR03437 family)
LCRAAAILLVAACSAWAQAPSVTGIQNAFSNTPGISPGVIASIYGNNFGTDKSAVTVTVGGRAAYVFGLVNTQINVEIPIELAPGPVGITVSRGGTASPVFNATLDAFSPAVLSTGGNANLFLTDNFTQVAVVSPGDFVAATAVGLGPTKPLVPTGTPAPPNAFCATVPQVTIGGLPAQVVCAASPGFIAGYQLNIRIPTGAKPGPQKLEISSGGIAGPASNVTVTSQGLVLSQTGLSFQAVQGGSPSPVPAKKFQVVGDPALLNFAVATSTVSGGSWLQAATSGGTVSVSVDATGLDPGEYYGLVAVNVVRGRQLAAKCVGGAAGRAGGSAAGPTGRVRRPAVRGYPERCQPCRPDVHHHDALHRDSRF